MKKIYCVCDRVCVCGSTHINWLKYFVQLHGYLAIPWVAQDSFYFERATQNINNQLVLAFKTFFNVHTHSVNDNKMKMCSKKTFCRKGRQGRVYGTITKLPVHKQTPHITLSKIL